MGFRRRKLARPEGWKSDSPLFPCAAATPGWQLAHSLNPEGALSVLDATALGLGSRRASFPYSTKRATHSDGSIASLVEWFACPTPPRFHHHRFAIMSRMAVRFS